MGFRCCRSALVATVELLLMLIHIWWLELLWRVGWGIQLCRLLNWWHWICNLTSDTSQYVFCFWSNIAEHLHRFTSHRLMVWARPFCILHHQVLFYLFDLISCHLVTVKVRLTLIPTKSCYFHSDFMFDHWNNALFTAQVQPYSNSTLLIRVLESEVVIAWDREILANIS